MSRRLLVVLAVAGAVATVVAAVLVQFAHDFRPPEQEGGVGQVVLDAVFVVAGLIAWYRRPENRVGPLMTALGFVESFSLSYWDAALPFTIASVVDSLSSRSSCTCSSCSPAAASPTASNGHWSCSPMRRRWSSAGVAALLGSPR